jgi:hypothetical protein
VAGLARGRFLLPGGGITYRLRTARHGQGERRHDPFAASHPQTPDLHTDWN